MEENKLRCSRCLEFKSLDCFSVRKNRKRGYTYYCKECIRPVKATITRSYYALNKGRVKLAAYKRSLTSGGVYKELKRNRTRRNLEVCSFEDFDFWYSKRIKACEYCSLPESRLSKVEYIPKLYRKRLTIDRKDNKLGYLTDNMVLACFKCNQIKGNLLSYKEMLYIGRKFIKKLWMI